MNNVTLNCTVNIKNLTLTDVTVTKTDSTITMSFPYEDIDIDDTLAVFQSLPNTITIDDVEYSGYTVFKSMSYDGDAVLITISKVSQAEMITDLQSQIEELQLALAELAEV